MRITADTVNNTLLIYASQEQYSIIEQTVRQVDQPQLQVAIDATIAEVTLTDDLQYGVQSYITSRDLGLKPDIGSFGNSASSAVVGAAGDVLLNRALPGFNFLVGSATTPRGIISALHAVTDVKVLSNPSLVVIDNQVATLAGRRRDSDPDRQRHRADGQQHRSPIPRTIAAPVSSCASCRASMPTAMFGLISNRRSAIPSAARPPRLVELDEFTDAHGLDAEGAKFGLGRERADGAARRPYQRHPEPNPRAAFRFSTRFPASATFSRRTRRPIKRTELIIFIRPKIIRDGTDAHFVAEEVRTKLRGTIGALGSRRDGTVNLSLSEFKNRSRNASWATAGAEHVQVNEAGRLRQRHVAARRRSPATRIRSQAATLRSLRGDYDRAARVLMPLAERGNARAQSMLGFMYATGQGVPQSYDAASYWYRLAAEQGDITAQYLLGLAYDKGQGVPLDEVAAYKWLNLAASPAPQSACAMTSRGCAMRWHRR